MLRIASVVAFLLAFGAVREAYADAGDFTLTLSAGTGWQASSPTGRIPTNLMVSPGVELLGHFLRLDIGLVADLPDIENRQFNIEVRPSLVAELPVVPIYFRVTAGLAGLAHGPVAVAFGPSVGVRAGLGFVSLLGEIGYIPVVESGNFVSILELRLGVAFGIDRADRDDRRVVAE